MVLTELPAMNSVYSSTMPFNVALSYAGTNADITQSLGGHQGPSDILTLMWKANNFLMQGE